MIPVSKVEDFPPLTALDKSFSNKAFIRKLTDCKYVLVTSGKSTLAVTIAPETLQTKSIELNSLMRVFLDVTLTEHVNVTPFTPSTSSMIIVDFNTKANIDLGSLKGWLIGHHLVLTRGATYYYKSQQCRFTVMLIGQDLTELNYGLVGPKTHIEICPEFSALRSLRSPGTPEPLNLASEPLTSEPLTSEPLTSEPLTSIHRPPPQLDLDFCKLGIGGLKAELDQVFRRFFLSRLYSPLKLERLGIKPIKGMILYGVPGGGKTLIARNIGKSLNCKLTVINGPEVLNKYVGESEANLRKPFDQAKADPSNLHLIILDEIDSICKRRGSSTSGVGDSVVNQLLTLMDGVNSPSNVMVIGLTNRIDMIDEALLRPGRFEVKILIPLPGYSDRIDILNIHTQKLLVSGSMKNVNIEELAKQTEDFSGVHLEGLVRDAVTFAMSRNTKDGKLVSEEIEVSMEDFHRALEDFKTQGVDAQPVDVSAINLPIKPLVSVLIQGQIGSGKTTLAKNLAGRDCHRTVKVVDNLTLNRRDKDIHLVDIYQQLKYCSSSALILDNIEQIIEYNPLTAFNNLAYQSILSIIRDKPQAKSVDRPTILVIVTSYDEQMINRLEMAAHFDVVLTLGPDWAFTVT